MQRDRTGRSPIDRPDRVVALTAGAARRATADARRADAEGRGRSNVAQSVAEDVEARSRVRAAGAGRNRGVGWRKDKVIQGPGNVEDRRAGGGTIRAGNDIVAGSRGTTRRAVAGASAVDRECGRRGDVAEVVVVGVETDGRVGLARPGGDRRVRRTQDEPVRCSVVQTEGVQLAGPHRAGPDVHHPICDRGRGFDLTADGGRPKRIAGPSATVAAGGERVQPAVE